MPKIVPKSIQTCFEQVLGLIFRKFLAHFSMEGRVFEDFQKKSKSFQNSKDAQKRSQKYPHVIWTCFGAFCSKNFCPVFHGGSSLLKLENSRKSLKNPNMPKIVPKNVQMCFEHVLWQFFSKIFLAQCSIEARDFENFQKSLRNVKLPKMSKIVPKSIQTCFEQVMGLIFRKFLPSFPWSVESSKVFEKNQRISKIAKMPKIVPKSIQTCFEQVLGQIFRKFLPSFPWSVESSEVFEKNQRISKIPTKNAQNGSQKNPKVFWTCFGAIFLKKICPVFHGRSSLRNFSKKIKKISKFQKCPKSFPKVSKLVLNVFWGNFFEKLLPSVPWKVESAKNFKKIKKVSKFQKCPKSFPKVSKRVLNKFWGWFFQKFS